MTMEEFRASKSDDAAKETKQQATDGQMATGKSLVDLLSMPAEDLFEFELPPREVLSAQLI